MIPVPLNGKFRVNAGIEIVEFWTAANDPKRTLWRSLTKLNIESACDPKGTFGSDNEVFVWAAAFLRKEASGGIQRLGSIVIVSTNEWSEKQRAGQISGERSIFIPLIQC